MPSVEDVRGKIAVVIPVGPQNHHARFINECMKSVGAQTKLPSQVVLVDDMHGLMENAAEWEIAYNLPRGSVTIHRPIWRLGVAHAFNHGSAVAFSQGADLALMLGADDLIAPKVIEAVERAWEERQRADGYYFCEVEYSDGRPDPIQNLPCNCAAWTAGMFRRTGGFSVESASGACDAAFISQMLVHHKEWLWPVEGGPEHRFLHRVHDQQQTNHQPPGLIGIRGWLTDIYEDAEWGRTT